MRKRICKEKRCPIDFRAVICLTLLFEASVYKNIHNTSNPDEMISRIEEALSDEYKKQSMTKLAATLIYKDKTNKENKIYYHILKTTFYESDPAKIVGLHTEALGVLFLVESMDSCKKMRIQQWDAALYKKNDVAYLCWTYSPEISYVLEYNPNLIDDMEIVKMAESAKTIE